MPNSPSPIDEIVWVLDLHRMSPFLTNRQIATDAFTAVLRAFNAPIIRNSDYKFYEATVSDEPVVSIDMGNWEKLVAVNDRTRVVGIRWYDQPEKEGRK